MSSLNQGRNEIRFNNSGGMCLMENWVEERASQHLDPTKLTPNITKSGHAGVLTTNFDAKPEKESTMQDSYRPPPKPAVRLHGKKQEMLLQMLVEKVSNEVDAEFNQPPEEDDWRSITHRDYNKEFESRKIPPTTSHDYVSEQPVTFWSEHKDKITGVSQVKTGDTVFRKNAAFSQPADSPYWDKTQPYDIENYPKM
ncbi:sperm-associated antigen 8-like [Lineus longissimus]|uniref:sperm-associated antigen 8-like n=1 Tax=Lineus longissimus TaxID=88925 RepID=UPI00315DDFB5